MTLTTCQYVCRNGHAFESPASSGAYGEFIVRGEKSTEPGFLFALEDSVYSEVDQLLSEIGAYVGKNEREKAALIRNIFGIACDPAPDQTQLRIERLAPCPICGTREMNSWEPLHEYKGATFKVTHEAWSKLSKSEKKELLKTAVHAPLKP